MEDMIAPGGSLTLADGLTLSRMGYGAMQLAGPGVFGPPGPEEAVCRPPRGHRAGVDHIDTSDFGPHVTNRIIAGAAPVSEDLVIVTKLGARRGEDAAWHRRKRTTCRGRSKTT